MVEWIFWIDDAAQYLLVKWCKHTQMMAQLLSGILSVALHANAQSWFRFEKLFYAPFSGRSHQFYTLACNWIELNSLRNGIVCPIFDVRVFECSFTASIISCFEHWTSWTAHGAVCTVQFLSGGHCTCFSDVILTEISLILNPLAEEHTPECAL